MSTVLSGQSQNGGTVGPDETLTVDFGGTTLDIQVMSAGLEDVFGIASSSTLSYGGNLTVESGGMASATLLEGGTQTVESGGAAYFTSGEGGTEVISAGGESFTAYLSYGDQQVYGTTSGTTIQYATQEVYSGGVASDTDVLTSATLTVDSGGKTVDASVEGREVVMSGGTTSGSIVTGTLEVSSGGAASGTMVSGYGTVDVDSGGSESNSIVAGYNRVNNAGMESGTTVTSTGSDVVNSGGTSTSGTVNSGGKVDANGGVTNGWDIAQGGSGSVESGGSQKNPIVAGYDVVQNGGTESGATVTSTGSDVVSSGGTSMSGTVEKGGKVDANGGVTSGWDIAQGGSGSVESGGSQKNPIVAGYDVVQNGGTESGATVTSTGSDVVSSGGTSMSGTVDSGGSLNTKGGAAGGWNIAQGGTLIVETGGNSQDTQLATGSFVNLANVTYQVGDTAMIVSGYLEVFQNGVEVTEDSSGNSILHSVGIAGGAVTNTVAVRSAFVHTNGVVADANTTPTFTVTDDGSGNVLIEDTACYVAGTRVRTPAGDVAIETLQIGSEVVTARGEVRAVRWMAHRKIACDRHPQPKNVWPVRISAGAMAQDLPGRDLWVSPGHSFLIEGHLIQAEKLENGITVRQVPLDAVEYWHIELDSHDVILAEGVPAETYLDTGNRTAFEGGGAYLQMHPDFSPKHWSETCYPLELSGPAVIRAKQMLLNRLEELNDCTVTEDADAHVVADGSRIEPLWLTPTRMAFSLPVSSEVIELRSRAFIPGHCRAESTDKRALGLCVSRLQTDGEMIPLERFADSQGWYQLESESDESEWRWTSGRARLPAGTLLAIVEIRGKATYRLTEDRIRARAHYNE